MIIQFPGTTRRQLPPRAMTDLLDGSPPTTEVRARMLAAIEQWLALFQERPRVALTLLEIVERFLRPRSDRHFG